MSVSMKKSAANRRPLPVNDLQFRAPAIQKTNPIFPQPNYSPNSFSATMLGAIFPLPKGALNFQNTNPKLRILFCSIRLVVFLLASFPFPNPLAAANSLRHNVLRTFAFSCPNPFRWPLPRRNFAKRSLVKRIGDSYIIDGLYKNICDTAVSARNEKFGKEIIYGYGKDQETRCPSGEAQERAGH
jgi:hypothetical protein